MAQNYETNIRLICRKSTDNWIDSLISFTTYTMYYFNMNLSKRKFNLISQTNLASNITMW